MGAVVEDTAFYNREAEQAVLGALLMDPESYIDLPSLDAQDFYFRPHRIIYDAVCGLYEQGQPVDPIQVGHVLERSGDLNEIGGRAYLSELMSAVTTTTSVRHHAELVKECSARNRLQSISVSLPEKVASDTDVSEVISSVRDDLDRIEESAWGVESEVITGAEALQMEAEDRERIKSGQLPGFPSGFNQLDAAVGGIEPEGTTIIAAQQESGKTTMALNMAIHHAKDLNLKVGYITVEMAVKKLLRRSLSSISGHDRKTLEHDDKARQEAVEALPTDNLTFWDRSSDIKKVCRAIRLLHLKFGCSVIYLDHFHDLRGYADGRGDTERFGQYLSDLTSEAREARSHTGKRLSLVLVGQLNREAKKLKERPQPYHLRNTGALEQKADLILGLHRPFNAGDSSAPKEYLEVQLLKDRDNGMRNLIIPMHFDLPTQRVSESGRAFWEDENGGREEWRNAPAPPPNWSEGGDSS